MNTYAAPTEPAASRLTCQGLFWECFWTLLLSLCKKMADGLILCSLCISLSSHYCLGPSLSHGAGRCDCGDCGLSSGRKGRAPGRKLGILCRDCGVWMDARIAGVWFLAQALGPQLVLRSFRNARGLCQACSSCVTFLLLTQFTHFIIVKLYHLKILLIKIQNKFDLKGV